MEEFFVQKLTLLKNKKRSILVTKNLIKKI